VIDKHRPGILRHCAIEPADRFDVPARVERGGGNPVTAEEMQTIDGGERAGDLKTFDRISRFAAIGFYPAAAAPRPGRASIERQRPVDMNFRRCQVMSNCVTRGKHRRSYRSGFRR
jgi:hypothetical protein